MMPSGRHSPLDFPLRIFPAGFAITDRCACFAVVDPKKVFKTLMFTGLVETMGTVAAVTSQPPGKRLRIDAGTMAQGVKLGDSIAIEGCCLTVVAIENQQLEFEAGEETLTRTTLGSLQPGCKVNLERSLAVGDRLGGHLVTGHIDTVGILTKRNEDPPWAYLTFQLPPSYTSQIAPKGSITVDGISLTVVDVDDDCFTVALIPHTLQVTTLGTKSVGDKVNLETDILAKYVQRAIGAMQRTDPS